MPRTRSIKRNRSKSRSRRGGDLDSFVSGLGEGIKNTGTALADTGKNVASGVGSAVTNTSNTIVGTTTNAVNSTKEKTGSFFGSIWPFKKSESSSSTGGSRRGGSASPSPSPNESLVVQPYTSLHSVPSSFDPKGNSYLLGGKRRRHHSKRRGKKGSKKTHRKH